MVIPHLTSVERTIRLMQNLPRALFAAGMGRLNNSPWIQRTIDFDHMYIWAHHHTFDLTTCVPSKVRFLRFYLDFKFRQKRFP